MSFDLAEDILTIVTVVCPYDEETWWEIDRGRTRAYAGAMRWDALFEDMEAQLAAGQQLGLESEISERVRVEHAAIELADRLRGAVGTPITVQLRSAMQVHGVLTHAASEWLVLQEGVHQWLLPYASVTCYQGLGRLAVAEPSRVTRTLGLASALRGLSRDRQELTVHLFAGGPDLSTRSGVIDRVGRDYFDLAVTMPGEARRAGSVSMVTAVPFRALAALRSARGPGT